MASTVRNILKNTSSNIKRNIWLSVATVLVTTIVFTTTSLFISLSLLANKAVEVAQQQAQLQIFFQLNAPQKDIDNLIAKLGEEPFVENIDYIDQKEALQLYISYYSDNPELVENVSEDWLPASLEVRATSLDELENLTELVREEQKTNPIIDEVRYQEDVVDQLKSISRAINFASIAIITLFSAITIALIVITISFNIMTHKNEIEIMHLVGSTDSYIKFPFILEGTFYTVLGTFIAASIIVVPWYLLMYYGKESNAYFILSDTFDSLSYGFLKRFNLLFILAFYGIHIVVGFIIGYLSSLFAVKKYLNFKEK